MGVIIFSGVALAHLALLSLVVTMGRKTSHPYQLCDHSLILGLQGPGPLSQMEFELNPLPGGCLLLLLYPWKMSAQPLGPVHRGASVLALPPGGECLFTAGLAQVMCLSGMVTWQEPSTSYFLQADEDGICLAW